MTARTSEDTDIKVHLLSMSTAAAGLTRIGGIDFGELASSFFRFGVQLGQECRPRGICNAFSERMIVDHPVDLQVFHTDDPIRVDDFAAVLVGEVLAFAWDPFMGAGHHFSVLAAPWPALSTL